MLLLVVVLLVLAVLLAVLVVLVVLVVVVLLLPFVGGDAVRVSAAAAAGVATVDVGLVFGVVDAVGVAVAVGTAIVAGFVLFFLLLVLLSCFAAVVVVVVVVSVPGRKLVAGCLWAFHSHLLSGSRGCLRLALCDPTRPCSSSHCRGSGKAQGCQGGSGGGAASASGRCGPAWHAGLFKVRQTAAGPPPPALSSLSFLFRPF